MATIGGVTPLGSSSKPDPTRTKVVIRRLPPTLPEETFWKSVEPWVSDSTCSWKRYVKGRAGDGLDAHPVFSRAYVLLSTPEMVSDFHRGYHGHVFRSKAGAEFQAIVDFAPIQKTSHNVKAKVDARQGTIDTEPDYLSFLETLKMPVEKPAVEVSAQPTTTPLLEHLRKHGKTGKGASKSQKSASSSDVKGRALASVTAAAAKRAPHADSGPILVAGKGREVTIATSDSAPPLVSATNDEGKKKRSRGKGKAKEPNASNNPPNTGATSEDRAVREAHDANAPLPPKSAKHAKPKQERPPKPVPTEGNGTEGHVPSSQAGEGRGGKRGRGGGGRGRGEGKDRSARGAVVSILSKNAEGEGGGEAGGGEAGGGRGGGLGRGRGRGRGRGGVSGAESTLRPAPPTLAAATARIDG